MPVLTKINTNVIADNAITAAKIPEDAISGREISEATYLANTANQNISGTYSENRLYTSDAYTLSANATVNSHLTLSSIKPTADVVLTAGGAYTITGTGVLSAGSLLAPQRSVLTGMTGALGSAVTQATGYTLGSGVIQKVHSFSAYVSSQIQMTTDNAWYEVSTLGTWTERWDSGQFASGKFTPTKSGIYLCGYTVFTDQLDDTERLESVIRKNGSTLSGDIYAYSSGRMSVSSDLNQSYSGSSLVTFNGSSDYISLWALHNQGQSATYLDVSYNEFWATYIGEI